MTTSDLITDSKKWKQLYSASESRWKDLQRMGVFLIPIVAVTFLAIMYVVVGYTLFHIDSWTPQKITWLSTAFYFLRLFLVLFAPVITIALGLFFIFKQATAGMRSFYQPPKNEKLGALISRRLLGVIPVPPPLNIIFKYPFIVIRKPTLNEKYWWARWLGGPANLVIYDGIAVYLERGNQFSRVVGPGIPMSFLEQHERIKEIVDLRPQTKSGVIRPWTKDGIRLQFSIRMECQIYASPEAIVESSKFMFAFDPLAVKTAVERTTVKLDPKGELREASWVEGAWGAVTGRINAYVAGHSLDELFFASHTDTSPIVEQPENGEPRDIATILSQKIREELQNMEKSLAQNGTKILTVQITDVKVPTEVRELREKYWESMKQRIAAFRNSHAEADRIRIREQAHAEAQRTMLNTITQRLERIDPNNWTEPLMLSLSGILDQGLDDPIVRPLIAKESFAVLDRVRKMLKEGF